MHRGATTALAIALPLAAGGLLTALSAGVDHAAKAAVPAALRAVESLTGARLVVGTTSAPHPLSVVVRDLRAERPDGARLHARRLRVELAPLPLLAGRVVPSRVVAEGVGGEVTAGGVSLRWADTLLEARPEDAGWAVSGSGWAGRPGDEPVPFKLRGAPGGPIHIDLGAPLRLLERGRLSVSVRQAELSPSEDRVRLSGLAVEGLPNDVTLRLAALDLSLGRGLGGGLILRGLDLEATPQGLARLTAGHMPGRRADGQARAPLSAAWIVEAPEARLALRAGGRTWALPAAELRLERGGVALVAASVPQLGPDARAHLRVPLSGAAAGERGELSLQFEAQLDDGRLWHTAVSPDPLDDLRGQAAGTVRWSPASGQLHVSVERASFRGAQLVLEASVDRLGDTPRFAASLRLPEQPCQALVDAVPEGMWQRLRGLALAGDVAPGLDFAVDMAAIEETIVLEGHGDPSACEVVRFGSQIDVARLGRPDFVHEWPRAGSEEPIRVGPGTKSYVPLAGIPPHVVRAMVVTEDGRFWGHHGVNLGLVRKALRIDLEKGRYVYGGSTITQQLVKNLFFGRAKTLSRKLEEALVALQVERVIDKRRILELYANVIEFGPDVYGLQRAARYYFDKQVGQLTPVEGAFLAAIKPKPSAGPRLARQGRLRGWWHYRIIEVMGWLEEGGAITPMQRAQAFPFYPTFRGPVLGKLNDAGTGLLETARLGR